MAGDPLSTLDRETFSPLVGERFAATREGAGSFELELLEVRRLGGKSETREPFSLIFRGPLAPVEPQAIYTLMHERLGPLDLFLVPVGPDRQRTGIRYEAVFS